jgi:hypothetical protein
MKFELWRYNLDVERIRISSCLTCLLLVLNSNFRCSLWWSQFEFWGLTSNFRDYVLNYCNEIRILEAQEDNNSNFRGKIFLEHINS